MYFFLIFFGTKSDEIDEDKKSKKRNIKLKSFRGGKLQMLEQYGALMSVADVQEVLGVGKNRVYEMLNDGTISSIRIGRSWKIPTEAVEEYLRSWRTDPAIKKGSGAR